jgi:hypothetical protein
VNSIQSRDIFNKLSGKAAKVWAGVLFSILLVCCARQTTKISPSITTIARTPTPFITPTPAATVDPKIVLHERIVETLGTGNRNLPRLTKISYSDPEAGDITITWAINENVSQNSKKADAQIDATNILKVLEENKTRFIYVILIGTFSTQDEYGNAVDVQVMSLGFNKSKLDKINWEDFQPSDIYDLADVADIVDEWE